MDGTPPLNTAADLDWRAARVADPSIDLRTKLNVASELREMIDTVREVEAARVLPHMIPVILQLLKSGEPSFVKDSLEFQFRRCLLETLHRAPSIDVVRTQAVLLFQGMLYLLRQDNEENGIICCKTIIDLVRSFRTLNEELLNDFMSILQELYQNMQGVVEETLSQESPILDSNTALPAIKSFKVLAEISLVVVTLLQMHKPTVLPRLQTIIPQNFGIIALEAPGQKKVREDYEATGGFWAGMAPTIKNTAMYNDFISAQIRMISYLAYILRSIGEQSETDGETLLLASLRILQDCPDMALTARKDLMVVFRHLSTTPSKRALVPYLDKLCDEHVLLGASAGSRDTTRSSAYNTVADLLHQLRADLTVRQATRVCIQYLRLLHDPYVSSHLYVVCAKIIYTMAEILVVKDQGPSTARMLTTVVDAAVEKLESMAEVQAILANRLEKAKKGEPDHTQLMSVEKEKSRPIAAASWAVEKPEEAITEYRVAFRTLLHTLRTVLGALKKCDAPVPDGTVISRLFVATIRCIALFDGEAPREINEALDLLAAVLLEVNAHVFQEVWTRNFALYFENAVKRPILMHLAQTLFGRDSTSPTLVAIVLRYFVDRLPSLGDLDDQTAAVAIRMYKMAFNAVTLLSHLNEPILASHLGKLIMDCFPLAAKAGKPTNYFHLLRALFRAIGGGGGRFELIYKEVLPLLPEMLECLNRQLNASSGATRDMIVELCLTVPLRLTHLLPYLSYLMQPLVLALRGNQELIFQGLRTLELCIDNLTPDFLDPTLNTVLRDLMEALHGHLRPIPYNLNHAHASVRILGKLGGRNRRLLEKEPALKYNPYSEPVRGQVCFGGAPAQLDLTAMLQLAANTLASSKAVHTHREQAFGFLEACIALLLHEGVRGRTREDAFVRTLQGFLDALFLSNLQDKAERNIRNISRFIFSTEFSKPPFRERRQPGTLLRCYLEALPHVFARENPEEAVKGRELIAVLIRDLVALSSQSALSSQDLLFALHQLAGCFSRLCLEESWARKSAGCVGIEIMTHMPDLDVKWVNDREVDLVRTLLHILKDMPYDLPQDVDNITKVLERVLRISNIDTQRTGEDSPSGRSKLFNLSSVFFTELSSSNATVRKATHRCIELLSELSGVSPSQLLMPHRDRGLTNIYTKPLRALPFPIQIGMIEAIRYCISLDPPLPELNDELLRLLHETLALADADDMALIGRGNPRQSSLEIMKLRVACIKLLTASMPITDFFARQHQTRQRVTSVYFKSLYSPTLEVKEVAHEGLRMVLAHQSRLPKELLQTGLRPILMNLADPKRLSIPGLEGLARLLELLTNYFKVEIGHKLLDHFRFVADPQMLQASSRLPLVENEGITKLVRLANIFHLLPSAANIFLEHLVNAIVQTEAQMHFSGESPFSEPLAKYLDRYPSDAVDFFMRHLQFPRHIRTLRSILQAKLASNLLRELATRTPMIAAACLESRDASLTLPGLLLFSDLADLVPDWLGSYHHTVDAIVNLWRSMPSSLEQSGAALGEANQRYSLVLSLFRRALQDTPRVDLLFEMIAIFSREHSLDLMHVTEFLHNHVALNKSLFYRRNVFLRFLIWFDDPLVSWAQKGHFMQYILTPMLIAHANRTPSGSGLMDSGIVQRLHSRVWRLLIDDETFSAADDSFRIELLYMTTVMVHRYSSHIQEAKKDIIKCAWHYITSEDPVVKHTAYLLAARFFEAYDGPQKFVLRAWTGLLRPPHNESKGLMRQAIDVLAPILPRSAAQDVGYPQWAKTTRRLLVEEGSVWSQVGLIYHLIVRHSSLFYPVRALFIPHIVNYLSKMGLTTSSTTESRTLSIDILQVIYDWEAKAIASQQADGLAPDADVESGNSWFTPVTIRESMVSYLVRLATSPQEAQPRNNVVPHALALLRVIVGPTGWNDVTVKLHYFSRALEQNDLNGEVTLHQAICAAKVLNVVSADKPDSWYTTNADILIRLIKKGMTSEDMNLQDSLQPVFESLVRIFPLPMEEDDMPSDITEFHSFISTSIGDSLRNVEIQRTLPLASLRGTLLMLKAVVQVTPERIDAFGGSLIKLLNKLVESHFRPAPSSAATLDVRLIIAALEICHITVGYLGDQRKNLLAALHLLADKSKNGILCRYMLDLARDWVMNKKDPYPTMKEKAALLQRMVTFEARSERGEHLFSGYLDLIYDIYTDPTLRRSDLTSRLEEPFLIGCRAPDASIRERFLDLLDMSVPRSLSSRLTYILGVQNWEVLADHNWMYLALYLLLGSVDLEAALVPERKSTFFSTTPPPMVLGRASSWIVPMQRLSFLDPQATHDTWVSIFPSVWACLSRREQIDLTTHMITLLSKDYHFRQAGSRPNVVQTLLEGIADCSPPIVLPPHLVKYLAKTYGTWHISLEYLHASLAHVREDELVVRDTVHDSLAELYAELAEDDVFYGLWRRRAMFPDTNAGLAFEQCGMWEQAASTYEQAQSKVRGSTLPFSEVEFCLWEDHWMLAAEKLQQWDTLQEIAKGEGNHELMLEIAWRTKDWAENLGAIEETLAALPGVATPRRRVFEAFIVLLKNPANPVESTSGFSRSVEEGMQLALHKWNALPPHLSAAHIPLLQHFQQFVELQEAIQIFASLTTTTAATLEKKSTDLKLILQAWRERLPNISDDISIWSDLVAWRQNVFNAINKAYIPLIANANQGGNATAGSTNTSGYRGYHETAWIINRFAHVARKHDLLDVCFNSLNRIYTLPNIEISEAFLKLREQARCHYQKPGDLQAGLEVINNTNLMYFSTAQKAEFYTLKGMFFAKLNRNDDANGAFGQAVQLDMQQAKAWAAWGKWSDRRFKETHDMQLAASAVSCYLQAVGLYKNRKSRPLLARVLWLLSVDDGTFTISRAFDTYKGDAAFWYWITLIPQLCLSISQREVKQARYILLNLAKLYPQALFFQLRTTREDMALLKRQAAAIAAQRSASAAQAQTSATQPDPLKRSTSDSVSGETIVSEGTVLEGGRSGNDPSVQAHASPVPTRGMMADPRTLETAQSHAVRQSWEYVDEVVQILKTAFPLLVLSLETLVEQIQTKFKGSSEEEIYRLVSMLLQDAMHQYHAKSSALEDESLIPSHTVANLSRLAANLNGVARREYEEDFLHNKLPLQTYIGKLQAWRDKYERYLDSRPREQPLDTVSYYLTEFQYSKFDEIEIPGQYLEEKDSNQNFVRIQKFGPRVEYARSQGYTWKRFTVHGNDNSKTSFAVQLPAARHCRREERVMQLFRTFNGVLYRKKESRKRNLHFHLPAAIACAPNMRLLQNDSSYITLGDMYDQYCAEARLSREEPNLQCGAKIKASMQDFRYHENKDPKAEYLNLRKEILDEMRQKLMPEDIISRYMIRTMEGPCELWRMRKQFSLQLAAASFMTYVVCLTSRTPGRFHLSRRTGQIAMSELLPGTLSSQPVLASNETVPFRFTPSMQHFVGNVFTEGVLLPGLMSIGRCLTEPEHDLEQQLCLFARDEVMDWMRSQRRPWTNDHTFRTSAYRLIEAVVKRAEVTACKTEREQVVGLSATGSGSPTIVLATALALINQATNPLLLARMPDAYMPWF